LREILIVLFLEPLGIIKETSKKSEEDPEYYKILSETLTNLKIQTTPNMNIKFKISPIQEKIKMPPNIPQGQMMA
jgi:hypothetical protein